MCGILGIIGKKDLKKIHSMSHRMGHRGPDERDFHQNKRGDTITHERLSIIDLKTGKQPIKGTNTAYVVHNGEIYNHEELRSVLLKHHQFYTTCDSEVVVHLYEEFGDDFCNYLDGVFTFIVLDEDHFIVGRDPIGVKPLYYGEDSEGRLYFASEMKTIEDQCDKNLKAFPPGHYYTPKTGFVKFHNPKWENHEACTNDLNLDQLRESLIQATKKRLMSDVPIGVLLSGGLDSSLTSAIAVRELKKQGKTVHSFSIGLNAAAPDLIAARRVADFLGTIHHEIYFTIEEGLEIMDRLVWHIETYDVTSVRASTPMYFLSKYIKEQGIKVVLSGEGTDEVFGGYLYFHNAPSPEEFQKETIRRVSRLSTADCLRADKSTMAHSIEARVPFLDKDFLSVAMSIRPEDKQPKAENNHVEKYCLRKAFDTPEDPYLPKEVLWRQKEQFSDGVGYNWIDQMIEYCTQSVTDAKMKTAQEQFPINPPKTKEAFYIRKIFEKHFPSDHAAKTVKRWIPKWQKNEDPSGRASKQHVDAVESSRSQVRILPHLDQTDNKQVITKSL